MLATTSRSLLAKSAGAGGPVRDRHWQSPNDFVVCQVGSGQRPYVLVHAEEVLRIVLRL